MATKADLDRIPEVTLRLSLAGRMPVLAVDEEIASLLGFPARAWRDGEVTLAGRIHADDGDIAEELFAAGQTPSAGVRNLRLRQADGRVRCFSVVFRKTSGTDGPVLELRLRDAKGLARRVEPMPAEFAALLENTDDFIFFKDRNHVLTGASRTLVELVGDRKSVV